MHTCELVAPLLGVDIHSCRHSQLSVSWVVRHMGTWDGFKLAPDGGGTPRKRIRFGSPFGAGRVVPGGRPHPRVGVWLFEKGWSEE